MDVVGTDVRRAELRAQRKGDRMFDRGPYYRELLASGLVPRPEGWPEDPDVIA